MNSTKEITQENKQVTTDQIMTGLIYYDDALFVDWVTSQRGNS